MSKSTIQDQETVATPDLRAAGRSVPEPVEGTDILDWEASLDAPPPRRSGTIRVTLAFAGRSRPIPVDDPAAD